MRSLIRTIVLCATATLLFGAALAPRLRADAARMAQPAWPSDPACTEPLAHTSWSTTLGLPPYSGVAQPFPVAGNVAACSLQTEPVYSTGLYDLVEWDAANARPDPTGIALRSVIMNTSSLVWSKTQVSFFPPVILRAIAHVAEPPGPVAATVFRGTYPYNTTQFRYEPASPSPLPTGYFQQAGGAYQPLPGAHGVVATSVCGGNAALQQLRVVQGVTRTDAPLGLEIHDIVQRFRVPRVVRVQWAEVALNGILLYPSRPAEIAITSPAAAGEPPIELPPALATGWFYEYPSEPCWVSHFDFDSSIVLSPGVDYWLHVTPARMYDLLARTVTGGERSDFVAGIGPMWTRGAFGDVWQRQEGRALCFKVIGDTTSLAGVTDPSPMRRSFRLEASPNPARGLSQLAWSGAAGHVRLEVLDARGRRVSSSATLPGESGRWTWSADAARRPLAAGVYFVRALDAAGNVAVARVAVIR